MWILVALSLVAGGSEVKTEWHRSFSLESGCLRAKASLDNGWTHGREVIFVCAYVWEPSSK